MKVTIEIASDNEAFQLDGQVDVPTVALNLHEVVRRIAQGELSGRMRDVNGNSAITFSVES